MKSLLVVGVDVEDKEVIVSLFGGPDNAVGTLRFFEKDDIKRHELRREAEAFMNGNILVDLAFSLNQRWRLIGVNRQILGGIEPTKLDLSRSLPHTPPTKPSRPQDWGLENPWSIDDEA